MGCRAHIAAWLLAATFAAGAEPQSPDPDHEHPLPPGWTVITLDPAGNGILRVMHACRWDEPRLFTRVAHWSIGLDDVLRHSMDRLADLDLIVGRVLGDPEDVERFDRLTAAVQWAREQHASRPSRGIDAVDTAVVRHVLAEGGYKLLDIPWDKPDGMHAYVNPVGREVALPESRLTCNGGCERSTVLHEMTHFFQFTCLPDGGFAYCHHAHHEVYDTFELAAYVVEVAERVRQGWTLAMFEANDRARWPQHEVPWVFDDAPGHPAHMRAPAVRPRMEAGLMLQYVRRYGPQFTGDMGLDLRILREWVRRFETYGRYRYNGMPPDVQRGWAVLARVQELEGTVDPLATNLQAWLACHGAPSAAPGPALHHEDRAYPLVEPPLLLLPDTPGASPEARARAERFLERASSR